MKQPVNERACKFSSFSRLESPLMDSWAAGTRSAGILPALKNAAGTATPSRGCVTLKRKIHQSTAVPRSFYLSHAVSRVPPYQLVMSLRDTHEAMKAFGVGAGFKPRAVQISFGPANRLLILLNKLRP